MLIQVCELTPSDYFSNIQPPLFGSVDQAFELSVNDNCNLCLNLQCGIGRFTQKLCKSLPARLTVDPITYHVSSENKFKVNKTVHC